MEEEKEIEEKVVYLSSVIVVYFEQRRGRNEVGIIEMGSGEDGEGRRWRKGGKRGYRKMEEDGGRR